jgi:hypothetical protein
MDQDKMMDQDETDGGGSPWGPDDDDPGEAPDKSLRGCYVGTVERRRWARETRRPPGFPVAGYDSWKIGDLWLLERVPGAIRALEATLEFHSGEPWTEERKARWKELTGSDEVSARALCDTVRRALAGEDVREDEREDRPITIEIPGLEPGADRETVERAVADAIRLLWLGGGAKPGEGH